jgi:hypothetical protein
MNRRGISLTVETGRISREKNSELISSVDRDWGDGFVVIFGKLYKYIRVNIYVCIIYVNNIYIINTI